MASNSLNGCGCPPNYDLINGECIKTETVSPDYSGDLLTITSVNDQLSYSKFGLRLYSDISSLTYPIVGSGFGSSFKLYDNAGAGPAIVPLLTGVQSTLWGADGTPGSAADLAGCGNTDLVTKGGKLNKTGIWANNAPRKIDVINDWDAANPSNLWDSLTIQQQLIELDKAKVSFEFCVDFPKEKQYLIGVGADNEVVVDIDGVTVLYLGSALQPIYEGESTVPFNYWHVFPITVSAGQHTIKLSGINHFSAAAFGAEIYDIDLATFQTNLTTPFTSSPSCGNIEADLEPYILFSTKDQVGNQVVDPANPGIYTCPDGSEVDFCNGTPSCLVTTKVDQLPCCYTIESCSTPGSTFTISLAEGQQTPIVGNIYTFAGDVSIEEQCFSVLEEIPCPGTELTDITIVIDYQTDNCNICVPCFELTNCADNTETLIIKWSDGNDPLESITIYVFDFDTTKCWTAEPLIPPCDSAIEYGPSNIVEEFEDCDDCLKPCYTIKDCINESIVYSDTTNLSGYVGQIISWNNGVEDKCGFVEKYICRENPQPVSEIVVLDCFFNCEDCLPKPEPVIPAFDLIPRIVKPGYDTPACTPSYYDKVKCNWSEAVYQHMASIRFGIEFCCEPDLQKWTIKNEILDIENTKYPDIDCDKACSDPES
tara:strand:+ start:5045 stop:7000 length:1956 start_codon:yes stop_codon:yes gene_type:complete